MRFRTKITLCMVSLMSILLGIGGSALISYSFNSSLSQEKTNAMKSYHIVLNTLSILNSRSSWSVEDDIPDIFEQLSSSNSWTLVRLSSSDSIIYEDGSNPDWLTDLSSQVDETHCAYKILSITGEDLVYYLQISGVFTVGDEILYLDIAYDISSIYESNALMMQSYRWIFILMILACSVLSWMLAFFLTRPLSQLSKTSRQIANGDYECRSHISSSDEVGQLSEDFNKMADHLVYHIDQIQKSMEQQNRFVGSFTHELKTPMTSIIGYADLLRGGTLSEDEKAEAANYIYSEGRRLERLSMTLLDIFVLNREKISFSCISPYAVINNLVDHYKNDYLRQGIIIHSDCDTDYENTTCMLEPDLFSSLIVNIMENARRAILSKRRQSSDTFDYILISCDMTDMGCKIMIGDTGCGIPKESLTHLTEEFYRVDKNRSRSQGGAGLGLALCHKIVQLHDGSMNFSSRLSVGTIITIELNAGRTSDSDNEDSPDNTDQADDRRNV